MRHPSHDDPLPRPSGTTASATRLLPALLVALVAFAAAWIALLPGLAFWDTGELQAVAPLMGTAHPTGFPTYVLLGWLASVVLQPFGEPAFRMNLFSAICVAVAAGVTVDLVRKLTGWTILGVAAGIALALTPVAWAIATHAEAHSLHLALLAILLWLLVSWDERVAASQDADRDRDDTPRPRRPTRPWRPLPGRGGGRLRPRRRQPLADAPAGDPGRAVRPGRRPGHLAPRPARPRLRGGPRAHRSRSSTWSCRCGPARSAPRSSTAPRTPGTASATSSWPSSSRAACRTRSGTCRSKFGELVTRTVDPVRHPRSAHPDRRSS